MFELRISGLGFRVQDSCFRSRIRGFGLGTSRPPEDHRFPKKTPLDRGDASTDAPFPPDRAFFGSSLTTLEAFRCSVLKKAAETELPKLVVTRNVGDVVFFMALAHVQDTD